MVLLGDTSMLIFQVLWGFTIHRHGCSLWHLLPGLLHYTSHTHSTCIQQTTEAEAAEAVPVISLKHCCRLLEVFYIFYFQQASNCWLLQTNAAWLPEKLLNVISLEIHHCRQIFFGFKYWILDPAALHNQSFQRIWPSLVAFLHGNHFWNSVSRISIFRILTFRTMISEFKMSAVFR